MRPTADISMISTEPNALATDPRTLRAGLTEFTRTLLGARSKAEILVRCITAALPQKNAQKETLKIGSLDSWLLLSVFFVGGGCWFKTTV